MRRDFNFSWRAPLNTFQPAPRGSAGRSAIAAISHHACAFDRGRRQSARRREIMGSINFR
jgi:hypothetical protein